MANRTNSDGRHEPDAGAVVYQSFDYYSKTAAATACANEAR